MKRGWLWFVVLCMLSPRIVRADDPCALCGDNCGESLGTLRGVEAFSNGNCTGTGRGFYQCVEYAKRFNGQSGIRWGNANQIFGRAGRLGLRAFHNGDTEAPRQGDTVTFRGGRYGHVAIIYEVGSDFVTLIEQNWHSIPGHFRRLAMNVSGGYYAIVSDSRNYTVEGWLRPDIDPATTDDDGDTLAEVDGDCDDRNPDVHPDATELCNTFDDNCDGETDELWPLLGRTCTVRISPFCERDGVWVCEPLHRGTVCDADYTIYPETCDGTDDDCDGETDEDWSLLGSACDIGFGECRRSGIWVCEPLHRGTVCDAEYVFGTPELCDSLDNDCDTETDEDWPELGLICGVFPCDGTYVCSLGGSGLYCNVSPGMPETCDGLDNDCDTETDESPAEFSCDDGNDCTADSCLLGACRRLPRDRDGDTYTDELCGGSDCNDRDSTAWTYSFATSRLTTSAGDSNVPVLAWTGTELAVAWEDWRAGLPNAEVYFARSNTSLARIGDEIRVTDAPYGSREPSLIWNGSEYGLSWYDNRRDSSRTELYFTRLDAGGLEIGGDIRLTDHSVASGATYSASLAWMGSEFGIAFQDSRLSPMDIFFLRLRPDGTVFGVEAPIVSDSGSENFPTLVWAGTGYGLAYTVSTFGYQQILFVRVDSSGSRIGDVTTVAAFDTGRSYAEAVDLVWQGSEFVVVWTKNMASSAREVYFRKLDATGTPLAPEVMITSSADIIYKIAITHNGGEYGVTWQESPSFPARAYFARLDESGAILGSEIELSTTQKTGEKVSVTWGGHEYLLAWSDNRDGDWEIYLGRIGCGW